MKEEEIIDEIIKHYNKGVTDVDESILEGYRMGRKHLVESIIKDLDLMSIDGSITIAKTEFLKGQKNGELMMIKKIKEKLQKETERK